MAKIEDLLDDDSDSDDSEASTQATNGGLGLNKHGKPAGLNDLLEKASAVKMARMKERRREWDSAPDFMKTTLAYERDENIKAARLLPLQERLTRAEAHKEDGNTKFRQNDLLGAMREYTKGLALFRWFERIPVEGSDEQLPYRRAELQFEGAERTQVERLIVTSLVNIAQVLIKDGQPQDAVWACTESLSLQPNNVKALYRRAMAHAALNSGMDLESAVNDLCKAAKISPSNKEVRDALHTLGAEHIAQRKRDQALYGNGLRKGKLYKESEVGSASSGLRNRKAGAAGAAGPGQAEADSEECWEPAIPLPPLSEDARQALEYEARKLGLDMDSPRIRDEFYRWTDRRREEDMMSKAKELGLDLGDADVRRVLGSMQKEAEAGRDPHAILKQRAFSWRRLFARLFNPEQKFNVQNFMYLFLLARLIYNLSRSFASMGAMKTADGGLDIDPVGLWPG